MHRRRIRRPAPGASEGFEHGLRFLLLVRITFVENFLQDIAGSVRISHVDVGAREIEFCIRAVPFILKLEILVGLGRGSQGKIVEQFLCVVIRFQTGFDGDITSVQIGTLNVAGQIGCFATDACRGFFQLRIDRELFGVGESGGIRDGNVFVGRIDFRFGGRLKGNRRVFRFVGLGGRGRREFDSVVCSVFGRVGIRIEVDSEITAELIAGAFRLDGSDFRLLVCDRLVNFVQFEFEIQRRSVRRSAIRFFRFIRIGCVGSRCCQCGRGRRDYGPLVVFA